MALFRPSAMRAFTAARTLARPTVRAAVRPCGRRGYADPKAHEAKQSGGDLPWLLTSVVLTVPAAYFLIQNGPDKKPHHGHDHDEDATHDEAHTRHEGATHHEENTEQEEEEAQSEPAASTAAKEPEASEAKAAYIQESQSQRPSDVDPAEADKWPGGPSTTSGKQERLDNEHTSNPGSTRPGLSVKGETDTETAKLRGSVDEERPQV